MTRPLPLRGAGRASRPALLALLAASGLAGAASPPDPHTDIPWDEDARAPGEQASLDGVDAIRAAFDNARRQEEIQFDLEEGELGDLELPSQAAWDALDASRRALVLANAERTARGGVDYPGGVPAGLPLEAVETHLNALAQRYADFMLANDYWDHVAPAEAVEVGDGPPLAGTDPFERLDADPTLGAGAGSDGADCHDFLGQHENLAVYASSGGDDISLPVEQAIYGFIYDDSGSAWGHRHLMLLQDVPLAGDGGFVDDAGPAGSEGYLGVGTAGANDGSYAIFDADVFPVQRNVVVLLIDPVPGTTCGYAPER